MSLPDKMNFAGEEEKILQLWERLDAFHRSLELSKDKPEVCRRAHFFSLAALPATSERETLTISRINTPLPACSSPSTTALPSPLAFRTTATSSRVRHASAARGQRCLRSRDEIASRSI